MLNHGQLGLCHETNFHIWLLLWLNINKVNTSFVRPGVATETGVHVQNGVGGSQFHLLFPGEHDRTCVEVQGLKPAAPCWFDFEPYRRPYPCLKISLKPVTPNSLGTGGALQPGHT